MTVDDEIDKGAQGRISSLRVQQRYLLQSLEQAQLQIATLQAKLTQVDVARDAAHQAQSQAEAAHQTSIARLKADYEVQHARDAARVLSLQDELAIVQARADELLETAFDRAKIENDMALARDELRERDDTITQLRLQIERLQRIRDSHMHNMEELKIAAVDQNRLQQMEKEVRRHREVTLRLAERDEMIVGLQEKIHRLEKSLIDYTVLSETAHGLDQSLNEWRTTFANVSGLMAPATSTPPESFELVRFCNRLKEDQIKSSNRLKQSQEMVASLQQEVAVQHADCIRLRSERSQLDAKLARMQNEAATVSAENARLKLESQGLRDMIASYEAERHAADGRPSDPPEVEAMRTELDRLRAVEAEVTNLRETCDLLRGRNDALQAQIKSKS